MLGHAVSSTDLINKCSRFTFLEEEGDERRFSSALGMAVLHLGPVEARLGQSARRSRETTSGDQCTSVQSSDSDALCAHAHSQKWFFISSYFFFHFSSRSKSLKFKPKHIRYHTGGLREDQTVRRYLRLSYSTQFGLNSH